MNEPTHELTQDEISLIKIVARLLAILVSVEHHLKPELRREVGELHQKMTGLYP